MEEIWKPVRGKKLSPEHVAKVAAALKGKYNTKCSKCVQALDKDGNVVMEFPSTAEAQRQGFNQGQLLLVVEVKKNPIRGTYGGLLFRRK